MEGTEMNAGQIIAHTLKLYGIEHFFAMPGGEQDIWLGLHDAGIGFVLAHSERAAVAMADAFARVTGKPSFTFGTTGPGAVVCVSGLADAWWGQSPVVCLTGSTVSSNLYRYAYQGIDDQQSLFRPITKWTALVPGVARLPDMLRTAIRIAVGGVPGPVHLDIPAELVVRSSPFDLADPQLYAEPEFKHFPAWRPAPAGADIERAVALLAGAKRPLVLAGGGVIMSEAWQELAAFAEGLCIPVVTSSAGKPSIPSGHPLAVGGLGNYSRKVANDVAARCDVCIVVGSNLGDHTTKGGQAPGSTAKIVHVDIDPAVLGAAYREEVSVLADAKLSLKAMTEASVALQKKPRRWAEWVTEVQSMVAAWHAAFREKAADGGREGAINPYSVMAALNRVLGPDDIVVADTGFIGAFGNALVEVKAAGRKYIRTAGSLGWAFPASLGAQLAVGRRGRVVCLTGDGGFGYHAPDVESAVRCGLPVLAVVLNNSTLGMIRYAQKVGYKRDFPEVNDFRHVDYGVVARGFGAYGDNVTRSQDVEPAMRRALDSGRPAVVNITTDPDTPAPVATYEKFLPRTV